MATFKRRGEIDCLQKVLDDHNLEFFMLLSTDALASHLTRIWASAYQRDWESVRRNTDELIAEAGRMVRHSANIEFKAKEALETADLLAAQNQGRVTSGTGHL